MKKFEVLKKFEEILSFEEVLSFEEILNLNKFEVLNFKKHIQRTHEPKIASLLGNFVELVGNFFEPKKLQLLWENF